MSPHLLWAQAASPPPQPLEPGWSGETSAGVAFLTGNAAGPAMLGTGSLDYNSERWLHELAVYALVTNKQIPGVSESANYLHGSYSVHFFVLPSLAPFVGGYIGHLNLFGQELYVDGEAGLTWYPWRNQKRVLALSLAYARSYENDGVFGTADLNNIYLELDWTEKLSRRWEFNQYIFVNFDTDDIEDYSFEWSSEIRFYLNPNVAVGVQVDVLQNNLPTAHHFAKWQTISSVSLILSF